MRDDLSDKLIHLTKGTNSDKTKHREEAILNLINILEEKTLIGGTGYIKGGYKCVCFSEAPISKLSNLLAENDSKKYKYQPYGVMVEKKWLFQKGGRPVIYGPRTDFTKLPEDMRYRHVRLWLGKKYTIDLTWEREWRIKIDSLKITPKEVTIIVPNREVKEEFMELLKAENWHYLALSDLGVKIDSI